MGSSPTPPSFAIVTHRALDLKPLDMGELRPPTSTSSGLFALHQRPIPPEYGGLRLRRAVLMFVVVGAVGLLAYASWQRMAHARPAASLEHSG